MNTLKSIIVIISIIAVCSLAVTLIITNRLRREIEKEEREYFDVDLFLLKKSKTFSMLSVILAIVLAILEVYFALITENLMRLSTASLWICAAFFYYRINYKPAKDKFEVLR